MSLFTCLEDQKDSIKISKTIDNDQHYRAIIDQLFFKGKNFLGSRYGILGGAMTWVSDHGLVSAISNAGGFGVLACGALSAKDLEKEIVLTKEKTSQPFGVNLIVFHPQIAQLVDVCVQNRVSHVFLGGGIPSKELIASLKEHHIKVIGFAPSLLIAKRMISTGIEALILEGNEAGGHVGPVSGLVLAQEILPFIEVPVFMAGGIGNGQAIMGYLLMGAAGCQLGTRFVCASESRAHDNFKQAFIRAQARDATLSSALDPLFPVIPVRSLENAAKKDFMRYQREIISLYNKGGLSQKEAQMKIELYWAGALKRAVMEGDTTTGSMMAGQSVGMVKKIEPCQMIIESLIQEMIDQLISLDSLKTA